MKTQGIFSLIVLLLMAFSFAPAQGICWESTSNITGLAKEVPEKSFYMPGMIKQVNVNQNVVTIFRIDRKTMYIISPEEKVYSEMTFDDMEKMMKKMSGQMEEKMKKLKEEMASMPEEQRKSMEQMMGGKMTHAMKDGKIDVTNSGKKQTLAGYSCTEYIVKKDGEEFSTIWATKDIPNFSTMKADLKEFTARMASMIPKNGTAFGKGLREVDGFPMIMEIKGIMTTKVTKIEKKNTPAAEFEVPAGYKKEDTHYGG